MVPKHYYIIEDLIPSVYLNSNMRYLFKWINVQIQVGLYYLIINNINLSFKDKSPRFSY